MEAFAAFLNMGGHATFVWPALASIRRLRHSESALRAAEAKSPVRRHRAEARMDTEAGS